MLAGMGVYVLYLSYKCYKGRRGTDTNGKINTSTNSCGNNNDCLRHIDSSSDGFICNAIKINQENIAPFQSTQRFELTEFDKLHLFTSNQVTNQTNRPWNELASSSSSAPIDRSMREHTAVQMNELYDESRSHDMSIPPPPYSENP